MYTALIHNIEEFISTAESLTQLSEKSRVLRKEIADKVSSLNLGQVNEDSPVEFILGDMVVSVKKAKQCNDYTVTYKNLKVIDD